MFRSPPKTSFIVPSVLMLAAFTACNQPPTAPDVTITPTAPTTLDDLVAELAAEATDPNKNDILNYAYRWEMRAPDAPAESWTEMDLAGATVPASFTEKGQSWRVHVTVSDGTETAEFTAEEGVTVINSLPEIVSVRMSPMEGVDTFGTLSASASATDIDGDPVDISYTWYVNGTALDVQGTELTGDYFAKNDVVYVEATPTDGEAAGEAVASGSVTILNTPPKLEGVVISPQEIVEATDVLCEPVGWYDADEDPPNVTATWLVNGQEVEGVTGPLTGEYFQKGDLIRCMGAPTDGDSTGATVVSDVVKVLNTAPSLGAVNLSNTSPTASDVLTFTTVDAIDPDGDELSFSVEWYVDGELAATGPSLPERSFVRGQEVYAIVTPTDGVAEGEPVTSDLATAINTPPNMTSVTLAPDPLYTDSVVFPTVEAEDLDGDLITYTTVWSVDGTVVGETGALLDGDVWFDKDQTVQVSVTPNDGFEDGPTLTSTVITVLNSPPTMPVIAMDPEKPKSDDDLWCAVDTESTDADGDDSEYTFIWTRNGSPFTETESLDYDGDYVNADFTEDKDVFVCTLEVTDGTDTVSTEVSVDVLDWAGPRNFTNCGQAGYSGPSTSMCSSAYAGTPLEDSVTVVKGGWQEWEVPQDGTYRIEAWGAQGGKGRFGSNDGALGARMRGDFTLSEGEKLWVLAGQMGQGGVGSYAAGGGGASWVMKSDGTVLLAAAGGGGNGFAYGSSATCGGQASGYPRSGATSSYGSCGTYFQTEGFGGSYYYRSVGTRYYYGGGGAGYRGDGTTLSQIGTSAQAATDFSFPMRGGDGRFLDGGFGGGGVGGYAYRYSWSSSTFASSSYGSGGGGGYTGGNGGYYRAGGGSSKNFGASQSNTSNTHSGNGRVTLDLAP